MFSKLLSAVNLDILTELHLAYLCFEKNVFHASNISGLLVFAIIVCEIMINK